MSQNTAGPFDSWKYVLALNVPQPMLPYLELVRLHEPLGIPIALSPFTIGLLYGACVTRPIIRPNEFLELAFYLNLWALVMLHALIAFHDTVDAEYDHDVPRKWKRPVGRGVVSKMQALSLSGMLFGLGWFILSYLPQRSCLWAFITTVIMMMYPFAKRDFRYPPVILALGYVSAIFQGMATVGASFSPLSENFWSIICLVSACVLLLAIFEMIYAFQHVREDAKAGVESLPVLMDDHAKGFLWFLTSAVVYLLLLFGHSSDISPFYYVISWASCLVLLSAMLLLVDLRIPADCLWWFIRGYLGSLGCVVCGLAVEYSCLVLLYS